jgi:hypothetical protein
VVGCGATLFFVRCKAGEQAIESHPLSRACLGFGGFCCDRLGLSEPTPVVVEWHFAPRKPWAEQICSSACEHLGAASRLMNKRPLLCVFLVLVAMALVWLGKKEVAAQAKVRLTVLL